VSAPGHFAATQAGPPMPPAAPAPPADAGDGPAEKASPQLTIAMAASTQNASPVMPIVAVKYFMVLSPEDLVDGSLPDVGQLRDLVHGGLPEALPGEDA
jgi:hypothetical protein